MRCPDAARFAAAIAAIAAFAAAHAFGAAEAVKGEIVSRLQAQLPGVAAADYALGSAGLDPQLRAQVEEHASDADAVIEEGRKAWHARFRDKRTLAGCFPNGGRRIAAQYPQYDARLKRVVTLEMAVNQCLKSHAEPLYDLADAKTMGAVIAYLRSLSNGQKVAVRVPAAAEERFEQGRRLYFTRMGQRNYACASCHVQGAGRHFGEAALSPAVGQATHWPVIRDGAAVTMQVRMRECLELMGAAPFAAGSDELNHLEYFLSYLSNGLAIKANPWRPAK
jgi:sulfur-oxidizing protein SoxA